MRYKGEADQVTVRFMVDSNDFIKHGDAGTEAGWGGHSSENNEFSLGHVESEISNQGWP